MGDRAWLAFFVRPNKSAVVRYPSADEVEQYKASLATQSAQQTAKYALLEDHLRLQLDAVGTEYTTGLVPGIIRELLSHGEKRAHQEAALTERKVVGSRRLIFDTLGPSNPQILSQHCIGDTAHRVLQLTVHRQMKNPSCGYFAIYNSLTCAEIALAPDDATATSLLENLSSPFAFWQRYWQMVQCLLFECDRQGRGCYPWSRQSVESRTLEREYAQFLVEKWPPLQHFGGTVDFVSVPECHSVFTGGASLEAFQAIQAVVQRGFIWWFAGLSAEIDAGLSSWIESSAFAGARQRVHRVSSWYSHALGGPVCQQGERTVRIRAHGLAQQDPAWCIGGRSVGDSARRLPLSNLPRKVAHRGGAAPLLSADARYPSINGFDRQVGDD
eukprot:m.542977 g.542977  ORF g.542977 m.542977 type:complete len:385 (-) comp57666_c0_seq3:442-1596(-)